MAGSRFVALRKKDCSPAKTVLHDIRSLGRCNSSRRSYQFRSSRSLRRRLTCGRTPRGCSSMVRVPAFQAGHAGSIPVTRSNKRPGQWLSGASAYGSRREWCPFLCPFQRTSTADIDKRTSTSGHQQADINKRTSTSGHQHGHQQRTSAALAGHRRTLRSKARASLRLQALLDPVEDPPQQTREHDGLRPLGYIVVVDLAMTRWVP